jgi:hypothetical protein
MASFAQSWIPLGTLGFSEGESRFISLAFNSTAESIERPFVAYVGYANSRKATVMKFDETNWGSLGNPGFPEGVVRSTSLAFSSNGEAHVAYQDESNSNKATVMKFNGKNWIPVGMKCFSSSIAAEISLVFSPLGEPYVSYIHHETGETSLRISLMKFNGTEWVVVGISGFSLGKVSQIAFAFSPVTDAPYVTYNEYANSFKETVMKFDGNNWITVGYGRVFSR